MSRITYAPRSGRARFPRSLALKIAFRIFYFFPIAVLLVLAKWMWVRQEIRFQQIASAAGGTPRGNLSDLYPRWLGTRELLLHRRDPYAADVTRDIQTGYYGRPLDPTRPNDPKDQQAFAYPVYVVFLLAPTVRLPFPAVQLGYLWLLTAITAGCVPLWFRVLGWRASLNTKLLWVVFTLGCFPAIQGLKLQQLSLFVMGLVAACFGALASGQYFVAGVLLALATIKPQLAALPAAVIAVWTLGNWKQRQGFVWGLGLTSLALIAGGEIVLSGWIGEFRRASADYWRYTGGGRSVLDVELSPALGRVVSAVLIGMLLYWAWRLRRAPVRSANFSWLLGLTMATTLAVIPMFAPYNQLLLLPSLMVITRAAHPLWRAGRASRLFLTLTAVSVFWPWIAAAGMVTAAWFVASRRLESAWLVPLATNFAIPTVTLGLLLWSGKTLRGCGPSLANDDSEPAFLAQAILRDRKPTE